MRIRIVMIMLMACAIVPWASGQETEESKLIGTLVSNASHDEKDAACHRLKEIGGPKAVPALAACLLDGDLSHAARQALQSMPSAKAGEALRAALDKTSGMNRVGIIDSIGLRRDRKALSALSRLLCDEDPATAAAAARSLGRIATSGAVRRLKAVLQTSARPDVIDGLLRCVDRLQADGHDEKAFQLATDLCNMDLSNSARVAACRARIRAAGKQQLALAIAGITGDDPAARSAALGFAVQLPGDDATRALVEALKTTEPPVQIALCRALARRGDPAACKGVMQAVASADPAVQIAALDALGDIGDESAVPLLAKMAADASDAEQETARRSLVVIHHGNVNGILDELSLNAVPNEQVELVQVLAARRDALAIGHVFEKIKQTDEAVQVAILRALASFGEEFSNINLVGLMCDTQSAAVRDAAEDAIVKLAGTGSNTDFVMNILLSSSGGRPASARIAKLSAAARINSVRALPALKAAVEDSDPVVGSEALRIMAQDSGMEALDDLLALAHKADGETERTMALRGYWRLVESAHDRSIQDRFGLIQAGLAEARTPEDRKGALSLLADIPLKEALACAEKASNDEAVKDEAELAIYKIAGRLLYSDRADAERVLRRLAEKAAGETVRANATTLLASLTQHADFIVPWQVSGPYRQAGKQGQDLFDIPLGPEAPDGGNAVWSDIAVPADPTAFWMADLSNVTGGDHCVIYLKTEVFSERGGETRLEIGSDDGIKLWVNGALVHANNAVRGFAPGQDTATATLKQGWNTFFAKITQHTMGCSMAIRIAAPPIAPSISKQK